MKIKNLLLLITSLLAAFFTNAQVRFYAQGASTAYTNQNYKVVFVLENAEGSNFKAPNFEGFRIVSGPNQSSSYQWVNGKTSQSLTYYYFLEPLKEGSLRVEAASIQVNGQTISTEAFDVTIKKGGSKQQSTQQNQTQNQTQNTQQTQPITSGDWKKQAAENILVTLTVDNAQPFVGEQVFVSAKLYQRLQTYGSQITEIPNFEGFWKSDIEIDRDNWQVEEYRGQKYNALTIAKFALFPLKDGKFTIDPIKLKSLILINEPQTQNFFGMKIQTMGYKQMEYSFESSALVINVKPLPNEGKPIDFSGAVGKFNLETSLDSTEIRFGSAVKLKTKINGSGNIMMIDEPFIDFPRGLDVFDPKEDEYISTKSNYINGNKSYEYVIVPTKPGNFIIPAYNFSYFDLNSKSYKTLSSEKYAVRVTGELPAYVENKYEANEVEKGFSNELKPIMTGDILSKETDLFFNSKLFYFTAFSPIILFGSLFLLLKYRNERNIDLVALRNKRALKEAQKQLKLAKEFLTKEDKKGFYTEIYNGLNAYVCSKLNVQQAYLTKALIVEKLTDKSVNKALSNQLISLLENAESALYSPIGLGKMQEDYDIAIKWIVDIENEIS